MSSRKRLLFWDEVFPLATEAFLCCEVRSYERVFPSPSVVPEIERSIARQRRLTFPIHLVDRAMYSSSMDRSRSDLLLPEQVIMHVLCRCGDSAIASPRSALAVLARTSFPRRRFTSIQYAPRLRTSCVAVRFSVGGRIVSNAEIYCEHSS